MTIGSKPSRLDQRVMDTLIEKHIFKREIITRDLLGRKPKYHIQISFTEPEHFKKHGANYSHLDARVVPYYTRAIESVDHILIPHMTKLGFTVVVTYNKNFHAVNVYNGNDDKPLANVIHESRTIAISTACLNALNPDLDSTYIRRLAEDMKK